MKKTDVPVVITNGDNNKVEVNVLVTETSSKIRVAIIIGISAILVASVLAVSHCCPELLAGFVRWIISVANVG